MSIEELLETAKQRGFEEGWKACENRRVQLPQRYKDVATKIIDLVCDHFDIPNDLIYARNRKRLIIIPRQISVFLLRKYTDISSIEIGKIFNQDHTTVLYAVQTVENHMFSEESTRNHIERLSEEIETYLDNRNIMYKKSA